MEIKTGSAQQIMLAKREFAAPEQQAQPTDTFQFTVSAEQSGLIDRPYVAPARLEETRPPANTAGEAMVNRVADQLGVDSDKVQVRSLQATGFNASTFGFPVKGELQMAAYTQGSEAQLTVGKENFVYRSINLWEDGGRLGLDVSHEGYWMRDERGVYIPDKSANDSGQGFESDW